MENNINKPIVKEGSIVQGCATGHHAFNGDNSMLGMHGGILEMRMKCSLCGAQIAQPVPGLSDTLPVSQLPPDDGAVSVKEEQTLEKGVPVEDTRTVEPEVLPEDPMEGIRKRLSIDPPWAEEIKDKYQRDQSLDGFWQDIRDNAGSGK